MLHLPALQFFIHRRGVEQEIGRCNTKKTYYNDQHQKNDVIKSRVQCIETLDCIQKIMPVTVVLSKVEQDNYLDVREKSPFPISISVDEEVVVDNVSKYVHYMDDQGGWENNTVLHPLFQPGTKPQEEDWMCEFDHSYLLCLCHLEAREHGQDESIYRSGDQPSSRWGIDGQSYPITGFGGINDSETRTFKQG